MRKILKASIAAWGLIHGLTSFADEQVTPLLSQNDFGGVGLWQVPTARMNPDGNFDFSVSHVFPYLRANVAFQALPWVEFIVRYAKIENLSYAGQKEFSGTTYTDKSMDIKFPLLKEGYYLPAVAIGLRDFVGTGVFSSEFINATKRFGPFDVTLGMAWGNMSGSGNIANPLCQISSSFCHRNHELGLGGTLAYKNFFGGKRASFFGGVEYQTPIKPLRFKVEYDPNDYQHEVWQNAQVQKTHWNFGAVYRVFDLIDLSVAYERGAKLMLAANLAFNFQKINGLKKVDRAPILLSEKGPIKQKSYSQMSDELQDKGGFAAYKMYVDGNDFIVYGQQQLYRDPALAAQRVGYVLYNNLPANITHYTYVEQPLGMTRESTTLSREKIKDYDEDRLRSFDEPEKETSVNVLESNDKPDLQKLGNPVWQTKRPKLTYFLRPSLTQGLGGGEGFYLYQLALKLGAIYQATEHLVWSGSISYEVANNLRNIRYDGPDNSSSLPVVRSDIKAYIINSPLALNRLQGNYFAKLHPSIYGQVYAGFLESMFAGVGGEVLYHPENKPYALGLDINAVQKRDYQRRFGLLPYKVMTGHLTSYYQLPFYNILSQISAGRYLAGDWGVTFNFSRQFDSGIILGGFATFTNVSAAQYGEGSFNKGVYITIPIDIFLLRSSVSKARLNWIPLTRDGGQMLNRKYSLYQFIDTI